MRAILAIILFVLLAAVASACGDGGPASEPVQVEGPAMIMFYTDG